MMKLRRLVTVSLALIVALTGFTFASADSPVVHLPETITWTFSNGTLTISGTGIIPDYDGEERPPWEDRYRDQIKNVVIGNGITEIGEYAFYKLKSLVSVKMADSVTRIHDYAFYESKKLKTVKLSENLEYLDTGVFYKCSALAAIQLPASLKEIGSEVFVATGLSSVTVADGVATRQFDFFYPRDYGENHLYHVFLPAGVTAVGFGVFAYCPSLPYDSPECVIPKGTTAIEYETFTETNVRFVWLAENTAKLANYAFDQCKNLRYIFIPWSCREFGGSALPYWVTVLTYSASDELRNYVENRGCRLLELEDPYSGNG